MKPAPKTVVLHFRVTPAEKRAIQAAANRATLTVSAWLRQMICGGFKP